MIFVVWHVILLYIYTYYTYIYNVHVYTVYKFFTLARKDDVICGFAYLS